MTDRTLSRADTLLTELIELVETARSVPMSSSCVLPREVVLDLLDDLRDVLPDEVEQARLLMARRDELIHEADQREQNARVEVEQLLSTAREEAQRQTELMLAEARAHAEGIVASAQEEAEQIVRAGRVEHGRLVSADEVHRAAAEHANDLRAASSAEATRVTAEALQRATQLQRDSNAYAQRTLTDLIDVLAKATTTAERGRQALAAREMPVESAGQPTEVVDPLAVEQAGHDELAPSEPDGY